jgi:hypothetical protein
MSKLLPDCVICHHNPAMDASGWCRKCDEAYNAQQEPEEMPAPSLLQWFAWAVTRPSGLPARTPVEHPFSAPAPEEPPYRFPF